MVIRRMLGWLRPETRQDVLQNRVAQATRFNGWMLIVASPVFFVLGIDLDANKPVWEILLGAIAFSSISFVPGVCAVWWVRHRNRYQIRKNDEGQKTITNDD